MTVLSSGIHTILVHVLLKYTGTFFSGPTHKFTLRPFHVTAGRAVIVAILVSHE
jgi:hypothetical protein